MRWALPLLLVSCGDPLQPETYVGQPLMRFEGRVEALYGGALQGTAPFNVAVFWAPGGTDTVGLDGLVEDRLTTQAITPPQSLDLVVFDAPRAEHRAGAWAIGRVLAYHDADGDGQRGDAEPFYGGIIPQGVLFATRALDAAESPTGRALPAGMHDVMLPLACGRSPPGVDRSGTCGVPVGRPCGRDRDCGYGTCVRTLARYWPDGACAVPDQGADGCRPTDAAWLPVSHDPAIEGYFVRACTTDADCARRNGRWACDVGAGACVPRGPVDLIIFSPMAVPPFCAADWPDGVRYAPLEPLFNEGGPGRPPMGPPRPR